MLKNNDIKELDNLNAVLSSNSDEVTLKQIIIKIQRLGILILSKWLTISICILIGGLIGFWYASHKKVLYTSYTTFVLEENSSNGSLSSVSSLAAMAGLDLNSGHDGIFQGENIFQLYKSRRMIEHALLDTIIDNGKKEQLIESYISFNNLRKKWKGTSYENLHFQLSPGKSFSRLQDSILNTFVDNINSSVLDVGKPDKKLAVISVEVKSPSEFFSKNFNDKIVKTVSDFYVETKVKKSVKNLQILRHQIDSVKNVLNGAIYESVAINDATPNLNVTKQILRAPLQQKSQFSAETNKLMLSQLIQNYEISKISLRKETPLIQVIDNPVFPLSVERYSKIKGIVIGGLAAGLIVIFILIIGTIFKNVMAQ